jgi:mannose-6-phosphate isomerase-like protein (cupin superfamily)
MSEVTIKTIEEMDYFKGPNSIAGIRFRLAGRNLGTTAWGMNVLEVEANCADYPEHDHVKDGQEEVYVVLKGGATLKTAEREWTLEPGTFVRVPPHVKRKFLPGPEGMTLLAIGATPGKAYEPRR